MVNDPWFWLALFGGAGVHWVLPGKWRNTFLAVISIAYVAHLDAFTAIALSVWAVVFHRVAPRARDGRRWVVSTLILLILGFLLGFKYLPPLLEQLMAGDGPSILLPLGLSYYSFKLIHYAVETARGNIERHSVATFAAYLFLFPTFTAGPIERFDHFVNEREEKLSREALVFGCTRIIHGLIKKFVLAEALVFTFLMNNEHAGQVAANVGDMRPREVWGYLFAAFLYAYFDFAGYSDIAIGASRLFGIRVLENFDWPFLAPNIGNFWKRWHMTLAGWCQTYVYMPLIGLTRKPYVCVYATFVTMGLWHTGSWNYLGWGLYHATGVAIALAWGRWWRRSGKTFRAPGPLRYWNHALTLWFVAGSSIFSATNGHGIAAAARIAGRAFGFNIE